MLKGQSLDNRTNNFCGATMLSQIFVGDFLRVRRANYIKVTTGEQHSDQDC
jgi:hypothetical protein